MNRKLALLTMYHKQDPDLPGRFGDDPHYLELGVYQLLEPSTEKPWDSRLSVENRMREQLENAQVLATKTFEDARDLHTIVGELVARYEGVHSGGVGGIQEEAAFRVTYADKILSEYFFG
jgi:hypothetical protein